MEELIKKEKRINEEIKVRMEGELQKEWREKELKDEERIRRDESRREKEY